MKQAKLIHGFELIQSREIKEIKTVAHRYVHKKSGAELIHLECEDTNKVFKIAFKTIPEDDTGCPHILEHSVLNGSKNYPAKGTFMELIKGSLNTFINAMTSSDWTSYPIASTNDQDFVNLMRVYLDAVFFPLIYDDPRILAQEGWHHELFEADQPLQYRGVVYNEMKGAFSSVDSIIMRLSNQSQFPDTAYGFESGGDPAAIPQLTNEAFLAFHKKYYDPSNSKISLYGDMDIDATLKIIDSEYLSKFTDPDVRHSFPLQKPFKAPKKLDFEYPIGAEDEPEGQYYLTMNYTFGKVTDAYLVPKIGLMADLLMRSPASPLKTAIRNSGLAKDSQISVNDDILQPTISFIFKQVKKEDLDALVNLVKTELKRIVDEGFDKKLIEASINAREFFLREAQMQRFPKGLFYMLSSFGVWNHGGDPLDVLAFESYLPELRKGITEPLFEDLVKAFFLENPHSSELRFSPVPGLIAQQEEAVKAELAKHKATMDEKGIQALIRMNNELKAWQEEPDTEEDLIKIPLLKLSDVDKKAPENPTIVEPYKEFTLLKHAVNTNGIVYYKQYFNLDHAKWENFPWIMLYTQLLGLVNSQNYSYGELYNEIQTYTGGITMGMNVSNSFQTPDEVLPRVVLAGKALASRVDKLMELSAEFAMGAVFDDPARLKALIRELKTARESMIIQGAMQVAIRRMFAPFSELHALEDDIYLLGYYHFLCELESRMETEIDSIIEELKWVQKRFINLNKSIVSITANESLIPDLVAAMPGFLSKLPHEEYEAENRGFSTHLQNEGIAAPVKVQFVIKGGNFFRKGYPYSGKLRVLGNILSTEYLYKELRVKGGAYGGGASFGVDGYQFFYSYRDPNLAESLDVYNSVADYIRHFDCSRREMEKYILGDISTQDYPQTPEAQGAMGDMDYIRGFTQADRQQIRDEVLDTKPEDLRAYADMVQALMESNHYAVFGAEDRIQENQELFDVVTKVFKK